MRPTLLKGNVFSDERGNIKYNNEFDVLPFKRIYFIHNNIDKPIRGWMGHKIEQRSFVACTGTFKIYTVAPLDWQSPSKSTDISSFTISSDELNVLKVPPGHMTAINQLEENGLLLVLGDYYLGEINDEYRLPLDYFDQKFN